MIPSRRKLLHAALALIGLGDSAASALQLLEPRTVAPPPGPDEAFWNELTRAIAKDNGVNDGE